MKEVKHKFRFAVSPRFEVFFALQALTDPESRIHDAWRRAALERLPRSFHKKLATLGGSPFLWPVIGDALDHISLSMPFPEMIASLKRLPAPMMQERILSGVFHEPAAVRSLLAGRIGLQEAIGRVPGKKREWLTFIGLYPGTRDSLLLAGLNQLLRAPNEFQATVCGLLKAFWETVFHETWQGLHRKLERSCEEKERLFQSCSVPEFAKLALLRVEIDERKGRMIPIRLGSIVLFDEVHSVTVLPSAFNDKRHWTGFKVRPRTEHVYFPYFDPSISVSGNAGGAGAPIAEPEADPALICRALGDATRFAMVSLLARNPQTSADLAKTLALSRPTVSHHIHALREAGLLEEKLQGNAVLLTLRRQIFEDLSEILTRTLFHSKEEIQLKKTRNQ